MARRDVGAVAGGRRYPSLYPGLVAHFSRLIPSFAQHGGPTRERLARLEAAWAAGNSIRLDAGQVWSALRQSDPTGADDLAQWLGLTFRYGEGAAGYSRGESVKVLVDPASSSVRIEETQHD
jgi:hypothetical protein